MKPVQRQRQVTICHDFSRDTAIYTSVPQNELRRCRKIVTQNEPQKKSTQIAKKIKKLMLFPSFFLFYDTHQIICSLKMADLNLQHVMRDHNRKQAMPCSIGSHREIYAKLYFVNEHFIERTGCGNRLCCSTGYHYSLISFYLVTGQRCHYPVETYFRNPCRLLNVDNITILKTYY